MRARGFSTLAFLLFTFAAAAANAEVVRLSNDCVLVAVEKQRAVIATARMRKVHVWARILIIQRAGEKMRHALCAYQPAKFVCVYDESGTFELKTTSHDPHVIARGLADERAWWIETSPRRTSTPKNDEAAPLLSRAA